MLPAADIAWRQLMSAGESVLTSALIRASAFVGQRIARNSPISGEQFLGVSQGVGAELVNGAVPLAAPASSSAIVLPGCTMRT